eukprot:m.57327 g.57327  ORF g.57327 m.57327 type:complete len:384 (-) comp13723_c0_seq1:320-1471(-)
MNVFALYANRLEYSTHHDLDVHCQIRLWQTIVTKSIAIRRMAIPSLALISILSYSSTNKLLEPVEENTLLKRHYAIHHGLEFALLPLANQLTRFKEQLNRTGVSPQKCPGILKTHRRGNTGKLAASLHAARMFPDVEWLLFTDADAFFMNWSIDPRVWIRDYGTDPSVHFILTPNRHAAGQGRYTTPLRHCTAYYTGDAIFSINTGVFYMRNSPQARKILYRALCMAPRSSTTQAILKTADCLLPPESSDQCSLAAALEREPVCHARMLPPRTFNSHVMSSYTFLYDWNRTTCTRCGRGDHICHAYGAGPKRKVQLLAEILVLSREGQALAEGKGGLSAHKPPVPISEECTVASVPSRYFHVLDPALKAFRSPDNRNETLQLT